MDLSKYTSRKFMLAAAAVVGLIASKAYAEAAATTVAYLTAEGVIDARRANQAGEVLAEVDDVVDAVLIELEKVRADDAAHPVTLEHKLEDQEAWLARIVRALPQQGATLAR